MEKVNTPRDNKEKMEEPTKAPADKREATKVFEMVMFWIVAFLAQPKRPFCPPVALAYSPLMV